MLGQKKVVCIIPARLASVRFPEKILQQLAGKPMLQWVWEAARAVSIFDDCYFAIDDMKTAKLLDSFGAAWLMTSPMAASGTDRLVEIMGRNLVRADIWVNWQGDEPFINEVMIQDLLQTAETDANVDCWTLKKKIQEISQIKSSNVAKVVSDKVGNAIYFSRSPIPFYRDEDLDSCEFYKHVGIYAFSNDGLKKISGMGKSCLEDAEKLEQLRFLEHGFKIRLHETVYEVKGIDTPADLEQAEKYVQKGNISVCNQA